MVEGDVVVRIARRTPAFVASTVLTAVTMAMTWPIATALAIEPPSIESESVTSVTASSAILHAEIVPSPAEDGTTTYRFEYGPSSSYGSDSPQAVAQIDAEGGGPVGVAVHLQGLEPATFYHFHVVTTSPASVAGRDESFTTQPPGSGPGLLDGRAWEMVSPPSKGGALIGPIDEGLIQASTDGDAITYEASAPFGEGVVGNSGLSQILSRRAPAGPWSSQDMTTEQSRAMGTSIGRGPEYRIFSPDLSRALIEPLGSTPLPPLPLESQRTVYRREASGEYVPLVTKANVLPEAKFSVGLGVEVVTATPTQEQVVLTDEAPLTRGAAEGSIYEWSGGSLQLASLLPESATAATTPLLGRHDYDVRNAISHNGTRLVWETEETGVPHLYLRDTSRGETLQLDTVEPGAAGGEGTGAGRMEYATADTEDRRIFFTDGSRLTTNSTAGGSEADLYEFTVTSAGDEKLAGHLTDLTATSGESADVQGTVLGASEGGTYVYIVARGVLAQNENEQGESALAGADNLYVLRYDEASHEWTRRFVAVLAGADAPDWGIESGNADLGKLTSRVSPDGRYIAFMSERSLTKYDNQDASEPDEEDEEVYLYSAETDQLVCASCDPTGARPVGVYDSGSLLVDRIGAWEGHDLAGSIPGWTSLTGNSAQYQSRYLSNSGRLFFDSPDGLVAQDVNGVEDVYEYEPEGLGSCTRSSEAFSERSDGCVGLVSSGTSDEESAFVDASETGGDVFFVTSAPLAPQDQDTSFDVYDAHECTAQSPCPASSSTTPPACVTPEACRSAYQAPSATLTAPPSATFVGAGNLVPSRVNVSKHKKPKKARRRHARRKQPRRSRRARAHRAERLRAQATTSAGSRIAASAQGSGGQR
jgi:WD40-like Beta Propeller Repeat